MAENNEADNDFDRVRNQLTWHQLVKTKDTSNEGMEGESESGFKELLIHSHETRVTRIYSDVTSGHYGMLIHKAISLSD